MSTIDLTNSRIDEAYSPNEGDQEQQRIDQKAQRMFELHASGNLSREQYRLHLLLTIWVLHNKTSFFVKRSIDLLVSLGALIFFLPVLLFTALAVKLDSPGPVFFRQQRVGKWGRPFHCYKFRSMYVDAELRKSDLLARNEADEIVFKIKNDPRVTRVGHIIRKFSIDELPQLINVLKGDMSLVGPRPPVPLEVAQYDYDQYRRLDAVPGITGLQQVSGRSQLPFKRWVELDVQYIEQQSLLADIIILLKTIPAVISGRGAY